MPGDRINITATMTSDKATSQLNSQITFASVFSHQFDGCAGATVKAPLGIATVVFPPAGCPIAAGPATFKRYVTTSKVMPKGSTTSKLKIMDQDGEEFTCIDMTLNNAAYEGEVVPNLDAMLGHLSPLVEA